MEETRIIVYFISLLVAAKADYSCLCNYNVELTVFSKMSEQASHPGSMYEFDCKATMPGVAVNQGWAAVAFEHQLGYVKLNDDVQAQMCPGDPPTDDLVTTISMSMATDSSTATTPASTGSPVSLGAQTTFTTMAPSSASTVTSATVTTVTSPPASTFTESTTPSTTTVTTTYPTTKGLVSSTEHTTTATTGSTEHTTTATTGSTEHTTTATTGSTEHTTTATTGSTKHTATATTAVSCPTSVAHGMTTTFQQSCYEVVPHHQTWDHAESDCRHKGGHLMHIKNAFEQDFITNFLLAHFNHEVWIGLTDHHHEEHFEWISGAPLTYTHWDPLRKNVLIHGSEDCVALQPSDMGYWDDRLCRGLFAAKHYYVCQYTGKNPGSVIIG